MLFNSLNYAVFLPIVFALFWLSKDKWRVWILLIASYIFYMSWKPAFILLIIGLTVANYYLAFAIAGVPDQKGKKKWLTVSVVGNLLTLAFFKYAYFFNDTLSAILKSCGQPATKLPFDIVLPLGISFFVFEFIHYTTDVYRGHQPIRSFPAFALFASFFPTQIAGPIKRFQDFIPQFLAPAKLTVKSFDNGISLILLGLFKKVLIADNLSFFVQGGFSQPELFSGLDLWIFAYAFAFQIYFDFSGYTDVARGSAMLFGYKVPINFNLPYLAANIAEFWHRWHISLSTWLRDYLFIPLGGSRVSKLLNYRNLILTMTLGGLWHGAAMHFLVWGLYHGLLLVGHKLFQAGKDSQPALKNIIDSSMGKFASVLLTFHAVVIGWVFFRAETSTIALEMLKRMFTLSPALDNGEKVSMLLTHINYPLIYPTIFLILPVLAVMHYLSGLVSGIDLNKKVPRFCKIGYAFALMFLILVFSPDKSPRFIYFQF
ncbi:MAG: Peptidoglycan O-acetyltransferase [bacterium ADurb.Bin425]|nr:MAG: Peptidoglycan O-acetyltransferase [bacterium ADurb.Bin425]